MKGWDNYEGQLFVWATLLWDSMESWGQLVWLGWVVVRQLDWGTT